MNYFEKAINIFQRINNLIRKISYIYTRKLPPKLIFIALFLLIINSVSRVASSKEILNELVNFYLATIGLTITLASVTFSYARVFEKEAIREKIINAGESFLHVAIAAILATLLAWLGDQLFNFQQWNYHNLMHYIGIIIAGLISMFLYITAIDLYNGLIDLEDFLFTRTRRNYK